MARRQRAKPGGLSRELADKLIEAINMPLPRRWAALYAGVSPDTFKSLLEKGILSDDDPECVRLAREVYQTEGKGIAETFDALRILARSGNADAAETYLRLMHPADFGGKVRTEPDEWAGAERHKQRRDHLLENPPPRMRAELQRHRWLQLPERLSKKEREVIDRIIARHLAPALPAEGHEKASE